MINMVINPVAFQLGNLSVKWYGIIMAVAIILAAWMSIEEGKKRQIISVALATEEKQRLL